MMFVYPESKLKEVENEIKKDLGKYFIIDKPTQSEKTFKNNSILSDKEYQIVKEYLFDKLEDKSSLYRYESEILFKFRIKSEYSNVFNFPTGWFYLGFSKRCDKLIIFFPTAEWFTYVYLGYVRKDKNKLIGKYISFEHNLKDLDITYNNVGKYKVTKEIRYYIDTGEIEIYNTKKLIDRLSVSKEESNNFLKFYEFFFKYFSKKRKNIFVNTIPFLLYIGSKLYLLEYLYEIYKIEENLIVIPRDEINKIIKNLEDTKKILKEKFGYNVCRVVDSVDSDDKNTYICIYKNVDILDIYKEDKSLENVVDIYPITIEIENKKEKTLFEDMLNKIGFEDAFDNNKYRPYSVLYSFSKFVKILKNTDIKRDEKKYYLKLYYILKYVVWDTLLSYAIFCDYVFLNNTEREEIVDNPQLFKQLILYYNHVDFVLLEDGKKMSLEEFKKFVLNQKNILNQTFLYFVSKALFNWDYRDYIFEITNSFIYVFGQITKKITGNKQISLSEIVLLLKIKPKMFKEYVLKAIKHYKAFPICIEKGKINIDNVDLYIFDIRYCKKVY